MQLRIGIKYTTLGEVLLSDRVIATGVAAMTIKHIRRNHNMKRGHWREVIMVVEEGEQEHWIDLRVEEKVLETLIKQDYIKPEDKHG